MHRLGARGDVGNPSFERGRWRWFGSAAIGTIVGIGDHGRVIVWLHAVSVGGKRRADTVHDGRKVAVAMGRFDRTAATSLADDNPEFCDSSSLVRSASMTVAHSVRRGFSSFSLGSEPLVRADR
jgi:hypothetical protein